MISTPPEREGARLWFATVCLVALEVYLGRGGVSLVCGCASSGCLACVREPVITPLRRSQIESMRLLTSRIKFTLYWT